MKNKHLLSLAIIFTFVSCTVTTNEERAEKLVSDCIKDYLTYPESYETISTRIDSSRINVAIIEDIIKLSEECTELYSKTKTLESNIEFAQSRMEFNSSYSKRNYNRAKKEKEEYELEIKQQNSRLEEKVLALRNSVKDLYDTEINGWAVTHRFRSKNDYGAQAPPQEMLFFCDLNFERCQGWTAKQMKSFFKIIECINESETDKALLKNLQEIRRLSFFL